MTQRERVLELLESGPLTCSELGKVLGIKSNIAGAVLNQLEYTGQVAVLRETRPYVYSLYNEEYVAPKSKGHHFDIPSLSRCSCCGKCVSKRTRKLEPRPTGPDGATQVWAFCFSCHKAQEESRKIPVDAIIPHISTLAMDARVPDRRYPGLFHPRHKRPC